MPVLIALALVLVLGSGAASNWQLPSGWQTPPQKPPGLPPVRKGPAIGPRKR